MQEKNVDNMLFELRIDENGECDFGTSIENALEQAELEIEAIDETLESIKGLRPECDKLDYILAASSGVLCGVLDVFLVGKPGESPVGNITDKWFEDRTKDFAKLCGWKDDGTKSVSSAIRHLEEKFRVPYDQRGAGDAASFIFDLNPKNHHFRSLAHNPSLVGLFFSILDQFCNQSHFISDGALIALEEADGEFELKGQDVPSKLFCGFVNWFGHLISDMSGSSGSQGRGMGIPSPLWTWTNSIIAIKNELNFPVGEFDKTLNDLALNIYKEGYDIRFQTAQLIPVFMNEIIVRLMYSVRRLVRYYSQTDKNEKSFSLLWSQCEPFSNPTVKRMLTVAHGTFCVIDIGDATIRGFASGAGGFNVAEFIMRLNIPGVGRFTISLYGEISQEIKIQNIEKEVLFAKKERVVIEDYIKGLQELSEIYDDSKLLGFVNDFKQSELYIQGFQKTTELAERRNVPKDLLLTNKTSIDTYFRGGRNNGKKEK